MSIKDLYKKCSFMYLDDDDDDGEFEVVSCRDIAMYSSCEGPVCEAHKCRCSHVLGNIERVWVGNGKEI